MSEYDRARDQIERLAPAPAYVVDRGRLRDTYTECMRLAFPELDLDSRWDDDLAELDDLALLHRLLQNALMDMLFFREQLVIGQRELVVARAELAALPEAER